MSSAFRVLSPIPSTAVPRTSSKRLRSEVEQPVHSAPCTHTTLGLAVQSPTSHGPPCASASVIFARSTWLTPMAAARALSRVTNSRLVIAMPFNPPSLARKKNFTPQTSPNVDERASHPPFRSSARYKSRRPTNWKAARTDTCSRPQSDAAAIASMYSEQQDRCVKQLEAADTSVRTPRWTTSFLTPEEAPRAGPAARACSSWCLLSKGGGATVSSDTLSAQKPWQMR